MADSTPATDELQRLSRPLLTAVTILEPVVIIGAAIGVVCGIIFATAPTPSISLGLLGNISPSNAHPFVSAGIAIAVASLLSGVVMWAVMRGLRVLVLDLAMRHNIEIGQKES
jgi:hypothetical protein